MKNAGYADKKALVLSAVGDIDGEFILEAAPRGVSAKKTSRGIIAAAAAFGIAAAAALILLFGGGSNSAPEQRDAVLPPIRMSKYPVDAVLGKVPGTIQEAIEWSDAVAVVRIGDWLGDSAHKMTTLFSAEAVETLKGELPAKFTLIQGGSSEFTYRDFPLFIYGNELLLFLQRISDEDRDLVKYPEDSYKITGTYTSVMDLISISGERYALPRDYALLEAMPYSVKNLAVDEAFLKKAVDELKRSDSIWEKVKIAHNHVYKLDELVSMIKQYL